MKGVLHLELPKAFSMAVRPFQGREAQQLIEKAYHYQQRDLNPHFWKYVLVQMGEEDLAYDLLNKADSAMSSYTKFIKTIEQKSEAIDEVTLALSGIVLNPDILSIGDLNALAIRLKEDHLLVRYFDQLLTDKMFRENYLISLGCESETSLFLAILLGYRLKKKNPKALLCIGRHHFENFSLLNRLEAIKANGDLFKYIDAISYYDEAKADTYLSLMAYFQGGAASNLKNVVLPKGGEYVIHKTTYVPQLAKPKNPLYWQSLDDYWQDLDLHPEKLHYNYPLINNQCYYSKCSFCVQIRKHMSVKSFEEQDAMDRSIAHLLYLRDRHGLKYFSFMDEALRPKDLKTLVNHQEFRKAGFLWNMRLIADANFKEDLIEDLYSAGCREALFGLETIQEDTAMDMVKVSQRSELKHIVTLIFKFSNRGIRLILSMIYNFPTAPKDEDKVLMDFARKLTHLNNGVDFIFNQFSLFGNTPVFENRQDYGIQKIYDPGAQEDLYNVYSYEAQERGCSIDDKRDFNYKLIQLDLKEKDYTRSDFANLYPRLNDAHALYYSSWGFIYRVKHQAGLYQELKNQILDAGYD